jgi:hypothetical protein
MNFEDLYIKDRIFIYWIVNLVEEKVNNKAQDESDIGI